MHPIFIYESSILSCAGQGAREHHIKAQNQAQHVFQEEENRYWGRFSEDGEQRLIRIQKSSKSRSRLDRAILLALACAEELFSSASASGLRINRQELSLVVGSARGAQGSSENLYRDYLKNGNTHFLSSPLTTAGFMSSAVAQELEIGGGAFYISSACVSSLQAIYMAAMQVNMAYKVQQDGADQRAALVIGAESCLSSYYRAQLGELGVLARIDNAALKHASSQAFIHRSFHPERTGMVLAEGAGGLLLGSENAFSSQPQAQIIGFGFSSEPASLAGVSKDGAALQQAIHRAFQDARVSAEQIDVIVAHGSATQQGDAAELAAYAGVFGDELPFLTAHKWLIGHTLGAGTLMSTALGIQMFVDNQVPKIPYLTPRKSPPSQPRYVLFTALGFGGQAGAMILERCSKVL